MIYIIFTPIKSFSEPSCPVGGETVILEKSSLVKMIHYDIKAISRTTFYCSDSSLTDPFTVGVKGSDFSFRIASIWSSQCSFVLFKHVYPLTHTHTHKKKEMML